LVIDDTAVPKKGTHSVGVAAQYASALGKTANCQTLVSLTLVLNPHTTLAIILGVSECPRAPKLQPFPQCANSAKDFERYLRSSLGIARNNIINLFDSEAAASDQLDQIEDWLARSTSRSSDGSPTDLMVYYTGHGGFTRNDQSYFLAVHRTREGSEGATSIRYVDLASSIKRH